MTSFRRIFGTIFALVVIASVIPLAACGGGGGDDDSADIGDISGRVDLKTTVPLNLPDQIIEVKDNSFTPDTVTIKAGTKVVWKWVDTKNSHSVQLSGTTSPEQSSGTFERVFTESGSSFAYQCGVHKAAMTGRIVVE